MPYVEEGRQKELLTEPQRADKPGDYNFLFTVAYLEEFINNPRYSTIHNIYKASKFFNVLERVDKIANLLLSLQVSPNDIRVASALAFQEFYRRIGVMYENFAKVRNGDLELYKKAEQVILDKFTAEVK